MSRNRDALGQYAPEFGAAPDLELISDDHLLAGMRSIATATTSADLDRFAVSPSWELRAEVASHPAASVAQIEALQRDEDHLVRQIAAAHPHADLACAALDPDPRVRAVVLLRSPGSPEADMASDPAAQRIAQAAGPLLLAV